MAATKKLSVQVLATHTPDTGREPRVVLDTNDEVADALVMAGFSKWSEQDITLAASAADTAFSFTNAVGLLIFSDLPIGIRLAALEALIGNVRFYGWVNDKEIDSSTHATGVLLTNPSTETAAKIRVIVIEKL